MSKVYTRTGDHGTTSLTDGTRLPKSHIRIDAYGTIDELNSFVGLLKESIRDTDFSDKLSVYLDTVQSELFCIASEVATPTESPILNSLQLVTKENVTRLEQEIDFMNQGLPKLANFILPGGSQQSALTHVCRTICRRVERQLNDNAIQNTIRAELRIYINRLSDWLFVLSRYINYSLGADEIIWRGNP